MNAAPERGGPLAGTRIIEIAGIGSLPFALMLLADMGAEILRIETPNRRELAHAADDPLLRGRSSLTLDLKSAAGRAELLALLPHADVLAEALRPGAMERLGLGPEDCLRVAPHLVYGRATGWGQTGPLAGTAGHDPGYMALTGALDWLGGGGPPRMPPFALTGDAAGALYLAMGVLAALLHARQSGLGQVVDASIADATLSMMTPLFAALRCGDDPAAFWTPMTDGSCPFARPYETADGLFMVVCALEEKFYLELLRGLNLDPATLPARQDRANWPALRAIIADRFRQHPRAHWEQRLCQTDACATPALSLREAPQHLAKRF